MKMRITMLCILIAFLSCIYCSNVEAQDEAGDQASKILCNVYTFTSGKVGKSIFILIICFTAGSFFLGKANVSVMIVIAIAGGVFFAAPAITKMITGETGNICPTATS